MLYLTMADGEAKTFGSFFKSDSNSLPSGSVHYSTDLSEDREAISNALEEVDRVAAKVLQYLFEPERCSGTYSESEDEVAAVTDTSGEK